MDSANLKRQKINKFGFIWGVTVMKILNFGSCNIDFVYNLDHIVAIGEPKQVFNASISGWKRS